MKWRVGRKVPLNIYSGDRPVCQCHKVADAKLIVAAVNTFQSPGGQIDASGEPVPPIIMTDSLRRSIEEHKRDEEAFMRRHVKALKRDLQKAKRK